MENIPLGLRKGTWTPEEDNLLRKCIDTYGEGKWHLVPLRAGLNRCRKSCRMRWLNYLKPNIKRGHFTKDEVDLIIRLHKLLGNRWTLIAGRLPGRTANDIKNFWNSHIDKKLPTPARETGGAGNVQKAITSSNILRPRTRTLSNSQVPWPRETRQITEPNIVWTTNENTVRKQLHPSSDANECISWWSNLLEMATINEIVATEDHHTGPCEDNATPEEQVDGDEFCDLCVDVDVLELLRFSNG